MPTYSYLIEISDGDGTWMPERDDARGTETCDETPDELARVILSNRLVTSTRALTPATCGYSCGQAPKKAPRQTLPRSRRRFRWSRFPRKASPGKETERWRKLRVT